ncbi:hypothetical protein B0H13DRAFT_1873243 [Mycena leptocephala]|nr:hypothetical protein B0H13DRAFT_1873243 [Mycena leptocephala]
MPFGRTLALMALPVGTKSKIWPQGNVRKVSGYISLRADFLIWVEKRRDSQDAANTAHPDAAHCVQMQQIKSTFGTLSTDAAHHVRHFRASSALSETETGTEVLLLLYLARGLCSSTLLG